MLFLQHNALNLAETTYDCLEVPVSLAGVLLAKSPYLHDMSSEIFAQHLPRHVAIPCTHRSHLPGYVVKIECCQLLHHCMAIEK